MLEFLGLTSFAYADLFTILVLIVMEGLLSCDNAVVLALLVKDLPQEQKSKALKYGIIGAYVFRIAALCLATYILKYWWLKVAGGAYLLWITTKFFLESKDENDDGVADVNVKRWFGLSLFWSTVISVELTDIAFSADSIAAAIALSNKLWVLIAGGLLGILAMRFAAQGFIYLLGRFPALETCAFVAVGIIGLKLTAEIPSNVIFQNDPPAIVKSYKSAEEYVKNAEQARHVVFHIPHIFSVATDVPEQANKEIFKQAKVNELVASSSKLSLEEIQKQSDVYAEEEMSKANALWNLELKPLAKFEGMVSSILIMLVFAFGFLIPNKHKNHVSVGE